MVRVPARPQIGINPSRPAPQEVERPGFIETISAAWTLENDIVAFTNLMTRPVYETDSTFNMQERLAKSEYRFQYPEELGRARSSEEFDAIEMRIQKEVAARETLAASGVGGIAAAIGAGLMSPTLAIPLIGPARGAKGAAQAIALAAGASGVQEAALFLGSETRTQEEALIGIAAGTVVGGLLGSAAAYMPRRAMEDAVLEVSAKRGVEEVSYYGATGSSELPPREFSPTVRGRDLPEYTPGTTSIGDEIVVYRPTGEPIAAFVDSVSDAGGVVVKDANAELQRVGDTILTYDPRDAGAKLSDGRAVSTLSEEELVQQADALAQEIEEVKQTGRAATQQLADRTAVLSEARRRQRDVLPEDGLEPSALERLAVEADELRQTGPIRDVDAPDGRSIGAAETRTTPARKLKSRGPVSGWVNKQLARLNPVTRTIQQSVSASASNAMARISDAGLKLTSDIRLPDGSLETRSVTAAPEGTVEARAFSHQAVLAEFVQAYDDAYSRHVLGNVASPEEFQSATRAYLASGTGRLPEGKMTAEEFGEVVYTLGSTGEASSDPAVNKAVAAQKKIYDYFKQAAEEAYQRQLEIDPDASRLFDPEGDLGPDVYNYIHQVYDTHKITQSSAAFKRDIADHAVSLSERQFKKSWGRWKKQDNVLAEQQRELRMTAGEREDYITQLVERNEAINDEGIVQSYKTQRDALEGQIAEAPDEATRLSLKEEFDELERRRSPALKTLLAEERRLGETIERLAEIQGLDDAARTGRLGATTRKRNKAEDDFDTRWRERGAVDLNVERGEADFTQHGVEQGEELYNKLTGLGTRASGMEILSGARGPELSRVLNLPFAVKRKWLNMDPENTVRRYVRQMSADVEMYRAFGSVNGARIFEQTRDEFRRLQAQAEARGAPVSEIEKLHRTQQQVEGDLSVVIQRLRHQRGLPDNPDGIAYRLGRAALDINVARLMGSVVLSSVPDVARPVMKSGLRRTFSRGWAPFVRNMHQVKATRTEARRLGIALDPILHNRTQAVFDMMDDAADRRTRIERGLGFLANKAGLVAGFDRWTAEVKLMAAGVGVSEISEALRLTVGGAKASAKEVGRSRELLDALGLDEVTSRRIWEQFQREGGSTKFDDGFVLPNTESWDDYRSMSAYRAALGKYVNDTIVTPGLDRPSWVDANVGARVVAQFRSFTFTSTNRVVMAGLQDQDAEFVTGALFSLALGGVSYYLYSMSRGGDAMSEANEFNLDKWADEAISRSGLLGVFAEGQKLAQNIPGLRDYASFSAEGPSRRNPSGPIGTILGPSFGLAENVANVALGMDEPTKSTLHQLRLMAPYQNVYWLRQIFDKVEAGVGNALGLQERRSPQ